MRDRPDAGGATVSTFRQLILAGLLVAAGGVVEAGRPASRPTGSSSGTGPAMASEAQAPSELVWQRLEAGPLEQAYASREASGRIWLRGIGPGEDRLQARAPDGSLLIGGATEALVERHYEVLRRAGSLAELWTVDADGRIWLGPRTYDGRAWWTLARDVDQPGLRRRWGAISGRDARGRVWVPFHVEWPCSEGPSCAADGLQAFTAEGPLSGDLLGFEAVTEADALGLRATHLIASPGDSDRHLALTRRRLYPLDTPSEPWDYPLLGEPEPGQLRNAGYLSAAARGPEGPTALLWVEEQLREGVSYRILAASWLGEAAAWGPLVDLSDGPLFAGRARELRAVAAAWTPEGEGLWLASSAGEVALRASDGLWAAHYPAAAIGLPAGARILALAAGEEGQLWLMSEAGLWWLGPPRGRALLYLPVLSRRR